MNGLAQEWQGQAQVLKVNIHSQAGREFSQQMGASFTPTFILFDDMGTEVWRTSGSIDPEIVRPLVTDLQ